jgi:hypothetical protein
VQFGFRELAGCCVADVRLNLDFDRAHGGLL